MTAVMQFVILLIKNHKAELKLKCVALSTER